VGWSSLRNNKLIWNGHTKSYESTKKLSQSTKAYTKAKEGLAEVGLHAGLTTFTEPIKYYKTHKVLQNP